MSDVPKRIERWNIKARPDRVYEVLKDLWPSMRDRNADMQARIAEVEQSARAVLNSANVPSITYTFYLNFAREVFARKGRMAGPSLAREVGVLLEKWVGRTLDRGVLERIRDEVMTVPAPGP